MADWKDRALAAAADTRTGAMLRCALGRNTQAVPRFVGPMSVTSDGFLIGGFVNKEGEHHPGALCGEVSDLERNVIRLANHLKLNAEDRQALYNTFRKWISLDYRARPGLRFEEGP